MTLDALLALLRLPAATLREQRVPRGTLEAQLAKPADRRLVAERVDALHWHAALNSATTGLPAEGVPGLAVVTLATRGHAPPPRLLALLHAMIPDPLLLIASHQNVATSLSVRPAIGEILAAAVPDPLPPAAVAALAVDRAPSLAALHVRWAGCVLGLQAFAILGTFPALAVDADALARRREAVTRAVALDREIIRLTAAAKRESQAGRRADLNARLQRARSERQAAVGAM